MDFMDIDSDHGNGERALQQKFTEMYEDCSWAFPGGTTFMDLFW